MGMVSLPGIGGTISALGNSVFGRLFKSTTFAGLVACIAVTVGIGPLGIVAAAASSLPYIWGGYGGYVLAEIARKHIAAKDSQAKAVQTMTDSATAIVVNNDEKDGDYDHQNEN